MDLSQPLTAVVPDCTPVQTYTLTSITKGKLTVLTLKRSQTHALAYLKTPNSLHFTTDSRLSSFEHQDIAKTNKNAPQLFCLSQ